MPKVKSSNERPAVTAEVKLSNETITTTLGFVENKKHSKVFGSDSGPLKSIYISNEVFEQWGETPLSITVHLVPNR